MAPKAAKLQVHPAALVFVILGLACWLIALGGIGAATDQCLKGARATTPDGYTLKCSKQFQWEWWGVWFEVCLLLSLFVSVFFVEFNKGRQVFLAYLVMCTVVLMEGSKDLINQDFVGVKVLQTTDRQALAYNAAAAGFVMLSMVNFVLLIIVGFDKDAQPILLRQPLLGEHNALTEQI